MANTNGGQEEFHNMEEGEVELPPFLALLRECVGSYDPERCSGGITENQSVADRIYAYVGTLVNPSDDEIASAISRFCWPEDEQ